MAEDSERLEGEEKQPPGETLEDFREEVREEHGPDGIEGAKDASADVSDKSGEPSVEARGENNEGPSKDKNELQERFLADPELEEARRQILEQYGQDGLEAPDPLITEAELDGRPEADEAAAKKGEPAVSEELHGKELLETPGEESPKHEDGASVGSFSRNDDQIVVTEQEHGPEKAGDGPPEAKVETSDLQRFPTTNDSRAEPEAEPRTLEAVDYGKGAVLRVPKKDLEGGGYDPPDRNAVVQLGLKDVETEDVEIVFARYNASDRRAEAYVGDVGGEKGSRYELVEAKEYDEDRFVRDFERGRCEHLQNVRLEHEEDKVLLRVDDRRVEVEEYRLSTSGSHVIMRGKLDGEDSCKIENDGRHSSFRFGRDYPVEGMKMEGDDLAVRYSQSWNEKHEKRLHLERLEAPERPSLNQFGREEMLDHVKMLDHPERVEGVYQFVLDRQSQSEVQRLLEDAERRGDGQYGLMKAEISERMVPNMLELVGWERLQWHPFNESKKEGASITGPDWLLRTPDGRLVLTEFKWWADSERAEYKGESQVAKNLRDHPYFKDEKVVGAYVATVRWDVDDSPMKVYLKQVVPGVSLER